MKIIIDSHAVAIDEAIIKMQLRICITSPDAEPNKQMKRREEKAKNVWAIVSIELCISLFLRLWTIFQLLYWPTACNRRWWRCAYAILCNFCTHNAPISDGFSSFISETPIDQLICWISISSIVFDQRSLHSLIELAFRLHSERMKKISSKEKKEETRFYAISLHKLHNFYGFSS